MNSENRTGAAARLFVVAETLTDRTAFLVLAAMFICFSALRWLDLGMLWGDGPLFLSHAARAYYGEVPFRDFATTHPPFTIWLFQGIYVVAGGPSFVASQLGLDVLSAIVVCLIYAVSSRVLPRPMALLAAVLALLMGDSGYQLFSLQIYSPSLLPGGAGVLAMALGVIDNRATGGRRWYVIPAIVIGGAVATLAKPEFLVGAFACMVAASLLAYQEYRNGHVTITRALATAAWPALGLMVGLGIFVLFGLHVGFHRMMDGLSGYGLAAVACPWWPTGLGLYGALGSIGQALVLVVIVSLFRFGYFRRAYGVAYFAVLGLGVLGAVLYLFSTLYFMAHSQAVQGYFQTAQLLGGRLGLTQNPLSGVASYFFTKRNVFLQVMWANIALGALLSLRILFAPTTRRGDAGHLFILILVGCALSIRQMFGDYAEAYTNVALAAFPFLYILTVVFLYRLVRWVAASGADKTAAAGLAMAVCCLVIGGYGAARGGIAVVREFHAGYRTVETLAGPVNLNDPDSVAIYTFVRDHSGLDDKILDIGSNVGGSWYGGGINFALHRASPVISTVFTDVEPPDTLMQSDMQRFSGRPAKLVIGTDPLQFGYGLGQAWNRCPFPRLVWAPHIANFDTSRRIPVVERVRAGYVKVFQSGRWAVFAPKA